MRCSRNPELLLFSFTDSIIWWGNCTRSRNIWNSVTHWEYIFSWKADTISWWLYRCQIYFPWKLWVAQFRLNTFHFITLSLLPLVEGVDPHSCGCCLNDSQLCDILVAEKSLFQLLVYWNSWEEHKTILLQQWLHIVDSAVLKYGLKTQKPYFLFNCTLWCPEKAFDSLWLKSHNLRYQEATESSAKAFQIQPLSGHLSVQLHAEAIVRKLGPQKR